MRYPFSLLILLFFLPASLSTQAAQCLQSSSPGKLCTASDFEVVSEELIAGPSSCEAGEMISGDVIVRVGVLGNRKETYDVGFFIGDGANSPINGASCTFDSLTPLGADTAFDPFSGGGPYKDLDGNSCGDTDKDDGTVFKDITLSNVLCQDSNNDGNLDVQYTITWQQSKGSCNDPTDPANFNLATSSKCINAVGDVDEISVLPPNPGIPEIHVEKIAQPTIISPGEDVDYIINVENTGPIPVTLDTLTDDRFGDLDGQGSCTVPQTIDPGQVYSCAFNAFPTGSAPSQHINVVTGSGTGGGQGVNADATATVEIVDPAVGGIGDLVWNDLNADGSKDENEQGIAGVTVNLSDSVGNLLESSITDAAGFYAFVGLTAGDYSVEVVESGPLGNLVRTTASNPIDVSISIGEVVSNVNFGYVGAEIALQKTANPQVITAPGEPVTFTVEISNIGVVPVDVTDLADDQYGNLFDSNACPLPRTLLIPGLSYICEFTEQVTGNPGDRHVNTVQAIAADAIDGHQIFAADDAIVVIKDPADGSIGNFIWQDTNGNGALDEGEFGLDNVTVQLLLDADDNGSYETTIATTSSTVGGEYGFSRLAAGSYRVEVTDDFQILREMYLTTPPEPRDIILTPGESILNADFGYADIPRPRIVTLKIPTQVVHDAPSSDVTYRVVVLNIGNTAVTIDELTDSRFGDLTALANSTCEANVTITKRNIYKCRFTVTVVGDPGDLHRNLVSASGSDSNGNVAFDSGGAIIAFRDPSEGAIGDLIWEDKNADGIFDEGEAGLANVTVELFSSNILVDSTITNESGNYRFTGLTEGLYQVRVTDTGGMLNNKVLSTGSEPVDVDLALGQNFTDADFGYANATIEVVKEGNRKVFLEPGGDVTYTVTVRNTGYLDVTLTSLLDDQFGDLASQGSCTLPALIPARTSVACQFIAPVSGSAGDLHTNTINAIAQDSAGNEVTGQASFDVNIIGLNVGAAGYLVWNDENGDGIRDISEPGIGGVTLDLEIDDNSDGTFDRVAASTVTRQSGFYAFIPIPAGNYRIQVTDQFGVLTDQALTSGSNPNSFNLGGGQLYTEANFGYVTPGLTGGGPTPPVLPPFPGPGTQPPEPQAIPTLPALGLWLLLLSTLWLGVYNFGRSRKKPW